MGQNLHDAVLRYALIGLAIAEICVVSSGNVHFSRYKILHICCAGNRVHEEGRGLGIIMQRGNSELCDSRRDLDREAEIKAYRLGGQG